LLSGSLSLLTSIGIVGITTIATTNTIMNTLQGPVEDVIHLVTFTDEEVTEELLEVAVVGLVFEAEGAVVVEVGGELRGEALAEGFDGGGHLLLRDTVVLLLLGLSLETLPRERTAEEVEEDVTDGFKIVTTGLFNTKVSADGAVTSSTSQVLTLLVGDVLMSLGVTVLLGETKVDDVDVVTTLASAHQEVVGLDIAMEEVLGVDVFNTGDHLVSKHEGSLEGELAAAEVEEIFERRSEEINDHDVVVTFNTIPPDVGNTHAATTRVEDLVETCFVQELRVASLDGFELDGNGFTSLDVGTTVDITEGTGTDLLTNAEFVTNTKIHCFVFDLFF